jgi:high-affinity iron transporter
VRKLKLLLGLIFIFVSATALANDEARELVHLLDYLSQDYSGAVKDGKILSKSEYQEQMEFSETAGKLSSSILELRPHMEIRAEIDSLHQLIAKKADPKEVTELSQKIKKQVIEITGLEVAPTHWPSIAHGQQLYSKFCINCHGVKGDGNSPASLALNPRPISFFDRAKMDNLSPFKTFNAVRIGVPNTAMMSQPQLSDQDAWDVSFYVMSLRHQQFLPPNKVEIQKTFSRLGKDFDLVKVSTLTDEEIKSQLKDKDQNRALATLRTHSGDDDSHDSLQLAQVYVNQALSLYKAGQFDEAKSKALVAYLEGVEPIEPRLRATDPELTANLENRMALFRSAIESRQDFKNVVAAAVLAQQEIDSANAVLSQGTPSPWITFFIAAAILLREGFEAVLIIIALLGVIRASGSVEAKKWVHGGWIVALGCGALAWFLSGLLMAISGAQRELMEGFTSIFAVLVLLYMGFWLHRTTEIGRWTQFINVKVRTALEGKKLFGLAVISFMAVFREAFETVLFLRALWLEGGMATKWAMLGGVLGSLALILVLAWAILKYTARIPIRRLFDFSSTLMALLAVILVGKGIHSLQEVGMLGITPSPLNLRFELIGFFPTLETTLAQLAVLGLALALWFFGKKPSAPKAKAALQN